MRVYGNHCNAGTKGKDIQPLVEDAQSDDQRAKGTLLKASCGADAGRCKYIVMDGAIKFKTIKEVCDELGFGYKTFSSRFYYHGNKVTYKGHTFEKIYEKRS